MTRIVKLGPVLALVLGLSQAPVLAVPTLADRAFADRIIVNASRDLNRARQAVTVKPSPRSLTLLAQATNAVETARASFRRNDLITARQFAARASLLTQDIVALSVDREDVRRRLERVLREIARLVGRAGDSPRDPLRLHLAEADKVARLARVDYLNGELDPALAKLVAAEKLIDDARNGDYLTSPTFVAKVEAARQLAQDRVKDADAQIQRAVRKHSRTADTGEAQLSAPPLAAKALEGARDFAREARRLLERKSWEAAAAHARLASRLATRASSLTR
jgi:hypothetical protein